MSKPILVLDFDGVIHSYTSGWIGIDTIPDPPVDGAFDFIREAVKHFEVTIYSSRSSNEDGIDAMKWYIHEYAPDLCDKIHWATDKPAAFVTIDDRAITFTGVWPKVEDLVNFKPWNKR